MSHGDIVANPSRFRREIPEDHRLSLDTRVKWLWNQRFGTIQTVWISSPDPLDKMAATLFIQSIMGGDLEAINLLFQRLEGGALADEEVLERKTMRI